MTVDEFDVEWSALHGKFRQAALIVEAAEAVVDSATVARAAQAYDDTLTVTIPAVTWYVFTRRVEDMAARKSA